MKDYRGWINKTIFQGEALETLHRQLEGYQARFLHQNASRYANGYLRSDSIIGYTGDHLHSWSRPYEYAYVTSNMPDDPGTVLDVGSGFSFFPYFIQSRGHQVTCIDVDAFDQAFAGGAVSFQRDDITESRLDQQFDTVYSVSVLEHIAHREAAVHHLVRAIKPGGKLILTMDCDLGRSLGDTTPCIEDLYHLIGLLDDALEGPAQSADLRRGDDLLTTSGVPSGARWRVPWQRPTERYAGGLVWLMNWLRKPLVIAETVPTVAVFVGVWQKK